MTQKGFRTGLIPEMAAGSTLPPSFRHRSCPPPPRGIKQAKRFCMLEHMVVLPKGLLTGS